MTCLRLQTESQSTTIDESTGLCTVCNHIFSFVVSPDTISSDDDCSDLVTDFHIGPFRHVSAKSLSCTGCRLILGAIWGTIDKVGEEEPLKVQREQLVYDAPPGQADPIKPMRCVDPLETIIKVIIEPGQTSKSERVAGSIIRDGRQGIKVISDFRPSGYKGCCESTEDVTGDLFFRGRKVPATLNTDLLKDWMRRCTKHEKCHIPFEQRNNVFDTFEIRLIDVVERKLITTSSPKKYEYVALSYVWGENLRAKVTTRTDLFEKLSSPYSIPNNPKWIPPTVLDTMRLVKDIGLRYLWVDALCIPLAGENWLDVKMRTMALMDNIYGNASLVIIAASGKDMLARLPGVSRSRRVWQYRENVGGVPFITVQPWVGEAVEQTVWNSRGWTFQEAALARRTLVITKNQMYWNCQEDSLREDMTIEMNQKAISRKPVSSLWGSKALDSGSCPAQVYCDNVMRFSKRNFRDGGEALWAFAGVLKSQAADFPKGSIWGLPYEILDTALLWTAGHECGAVEIRDSGSMTSSVKCGNGHRIHSKEGELRNYGFPSFSWLSQGGTLNFLHLCEKNVVSKVSWHMPLYHASQAMQITYVEAAYPNINELLKAFRSRPTNTLLSDDTRDDGSVFMDYGYLRFTAQQAQLDIRREETEPRKCHDYHAVEWLDAGVYNVHGERIGAIRIFDWFLMGRDTRLGECVLLSANVTDTEDDVCKRSIVNDGEEVMSKRNVTHVDGCEHIESYNIMLLQWGEHITPEDYMAYRIGLGKVEKKAWENLNTYERYITLW
ncbi:heterokaryon incompatibility protein-domain-containing protein [Hypoxylon rubiginosum]|uniref:Heterokaryon incompatibility protein-domain-containing protein n=1 Tax=Hypoxylon rubiginosum TaxID=110542 RepID=A0ACC0D9S2_9PEZI|nr:heterokaryon incompatibility protein-domain-containing protein [Hypoxylon rubiginosum]